jgi:glutamate/aspartate transport system substrate-binding protein
MLDGTAARLYARWFMQPVPPNGVTVGIPLGTLLRDQFRWPTDRTGDEAVAPQK